MKLSSSKEKNSYNEFLFKPNDDILRTPLIDGSNLPLMEHCVSLGALKGDSFFPSGTGTFIAPYLIVSAKHVITDFWSKFTSLPFKNDGEMPFSILAAQFPKGKPPIVWIVDCVSFNADTDIVYLKVSPYINADRYKFHSFPTIQFNPPKEGSKLICFGYNKTTGTIKNKIIRLRAAASISQGTVTQVFGERLDSSMKPFPVLVTDAKIDGGMSGGPCFNEKGQLCGVNTSGWTFASSDEIPISYVSLIWASVGIKIKATFIKSKQLSLKDEYRIFDLCKAGYVNSLSYDQIIFSPNRGHISLAHDGPHFKRMITYELKEEYYNSLLFLKKYYKLKGIERPIDNSIAKFLLFRIVKKIFFKLIRPFNMRRLNKKIAVLTLFSQKKALHG